jgi:hypothetical protein
MVDRLVAIVVTTVNTKPALPPGPAGVDVKQIPNAFDEQHPYDVKLLVLAPGGDSWRPSTEDPTVADAVLAAANKLETFIRPLETGAALAQNLLEAQQEEQVIFAVIDAATPQQAVLEQINSLALPNLAVLLVDAGSPSVGATAWLEQRGPGAFANARAAGLMRVAGPKELKGQIELAVDDARRRLRAGQPAARAKDAQLAQTALSNGINVAFQPTLAGPAPEGRT